MNNKEHGSLDAILAVLIFTFGLAFFGCVIGAALAALWKLWAILAVLA